MDHGELITRQQHHLERIREQARLRDEHRIRAEEFDVEVEKLRGENERELTRLTHALNIENRQLDLQYNEFKNGQQLRMEALQTSIKQQDDLFRHFWVLDAEVLRLEASLIEKKADALIAERASEQKHRHDMTAKQSDQHHDLALEADRRVTLAYENDLGHVDKWRTQSRIDVMSMKPR